MIPYDLIYLHIKLQLQYLIPHYKIVIIDGHQNEEQKDLINLFKLLYNKNKTPRVPQEYILSILEKTQIFI